MFTGPPVTSPGSDTRPHGRVGDGDVARVRFRRALALLLMTLVLPGSAQLVAGNQPVGRIALRVVLVLVATTAFVVLLGWKWHGVVYFLASNTFMLGLLRLVVVPSGAGIVWQDGGHDTRYDALRCRVKMSPLRNIPTRDKLPP